MSVTIYPTNLKYKNSNGQFQSATAIKGDSGEGIVVQVSGTTPTIVCEDNHRYICGEVLSLNITPPANGVCEIIFESGSTATLLTAPNTIKWPEWFNPNSLEISATYQFKISNGLANVAIWPDEGLTGDTRVRIQKMLGLYEAPWELIKADTGTNTTSEDIIISADSLGQAFELTDIRLIFHTPTQDTAAVVGNYGRVRLIYNNDSSDLLYFGSYTQAAQAGARTSAIQLIQKNGMIEHTNWRNSTNNQDHTNTTILNIGMTNNNLWQYPGNNIRAYSKIIIDAITGTWEYKLYGKRKWN